MNMADVLETPIPFVFEEEIGGRKKLWKLAVHPRTFDVESEFQLWLEGRQMACARRNRANLSPDDYERLLVNVTRDAACGVFEFGTARVWEALHTPSGWAYNAYLQLRPSDPTVTLALVERVLKDPDKFKELDALIARMNDPNRGRPAQAAAPAPETPPAPS